MSEGNHEAAEDNDANFTANLILLGIAEVSRYKSIHFDKYFKINSSSSSQLSERQFQILHLIEHAKINTVSEISQISKLSGSGLSLVISKLVKNGLIYKKYPEFDDDKRKTYFYLTEDGKAVLKDFDEQLIINVADFYESLDDYQKEMFGRCFQCMLVFMPEYESMQPEMKWNVPLETESRQIAAKIVQTMLQFTATLKKIFAEDITSPGCVQEDSGNAALSGGQFSILLYMYTKRVNTLRELSAVTGNSESTLSTTLSRMEEEGWLSKERPEPAEDGRRVYFYMTEAGKKEFIRMRMQVTSLIVKLCDRLSAEQREQLYEGAKAVYTIFSNSKLEEAK